jgi:hypothetical protein
MHAIANHELAMQLRTSAACCLPGFPHHRHGRLCPSNQHALMQRWNPANSEPSRSNRAVVPVYPI